MPPAEWRGGLVGGTGRASTAPGVAPSDREGEGLRPIVPGLADRRIAERLDARVRTAGTHQARATATLGAEGRAGIVARAIRAGWMAGG